MEDVFLAILLLWLLAALTALAVMVWRIGREM